VFVGSLEPRKNLATLLAAWKAIAKRYPDVSLILAGGRGAIFRDVTLRTDLDRVRWLGYVPDSALPALYS
jgi:glycosyltransferase involved in cell wall biosynthesis